MLDGAGRRIWRLPAAPVDYQHILRGRGHRWWKPLLSLLFVVAAYVVPLLAVSLLIAIVLGVQDAMGGGSALLRDLMALDMNNPGVMAYSMLTLAWFIPVALIAVRVVHGVKAGYLSSVAGRFRWGWAATCLLVTVPLWVAVYGVQLLLEGVRLTDLNPPDNWPLLLAIILLLVPLQSAGEEYVFRGYMTQAFGSWFKHRWVALFVPSVFSVAFFALLHGSLDPLVLLDLSLFAGAAVYITWRTGGLEAAVAVHATNNVLIFIGTMMAGDLNIGIVGEESTQSGGSLLWSALLIGLAAVGLTLLAKWRGVQRQFEPVPVPAPQVPRLVVPQFAAPALAAPQPIPPYHAQQPYPTPYPAAPHYPQPTQQIPYSQGESGHGKAAPHYATPPVQDSAPPAPPSQPRGS